MAHTHNVHRRANEEVLRNVVHYYEQQDKFDQPRKGIHLTNIVIHGLLTAFDGKNLPRNAATLLAASAFAELVMLIASYQNKKKAQKKLEAAIVKILTE